MHVDFKLNRADYIFLFNIFKSERVVAFAKKSTVFGF